MVQQLCCQIFATAGCAEALCEILSSPLVGEGPAFHSKSPGKRPIERQAIVGVYYAA